MVAELPATHSPLRQAIDALTAEPVDTLSDGALGSDLVDIRRSIDRLEGEFLRRLNRFDRSHGALADGPVSTISWLRNHCSVAGTVAGQQVRMARVLAELPKASQSLCAGRAPLTNVAMIARLADDIGVTATSPVERTLVTAAEKLDPRQMRYLTAVTRLRLDADGALRDGNRAHDRRWFSCDQLGDVFIVRGQLDVEGGALVKAAIDTLSRPTVNEDTRSGSQRRADALVDLAARHLRCGEVATVHGQRPHLTVTASIEALRGMPGAEVAELSGVGPVHPQTARRIACDSSCTVVAVATPRDATPLGVLAAPVKPLSVGRTTRSIPAHIRTAMAVRDKGCRFPGCDRPPGWTDGHHIEHWADLAPTELPNLVSLCRHHHRFVHEKGWRVRLADDGDVLITPPVAAREGWTATSVWPARLEVGARPSRGCS